MAGQGLTPDNILNLVVVLRSTAHSLTTNTVTPMSDDFVGTGDSVTVTYTVFVNLPGLTATRLQTQIQTAVTSGTYITTF